MPSLERPTSLADAARRMAGGEHPTAVLREFLDAFSLAPAGERAGMLAETPMALDEHKDAYLAATAEHLAARHRLKVPAWALAPGRFLHRPWFPCGLESLKATLLAQSPAAFRRRMIFVDLDPLSRPHGGA
jgi:hypothetical protein